MAACLRWIPKLIRKKSFGEEDVQRTNLRRCLTTLDLIGLGTGSTLGSGAYVLSGQVGRLTAGPAVVVSFLIAGLAAAFAGLCYAEFAARVPCAGSAYIYSYVTVGELMAFVIGWNILLEYIINVASMARALSAYLDYILGHKMGQFFQLYLPISVDWLAAYPDFFAFGLIVVLTGVVSVGVKESSTVNNVLTAVNVVILILIIICGLTQADLHNWALSGDELPPSGAGSGGFAPFGFPGVMAGAATCFFAYVGFDFIASMGEEAENCRWSIPVSMGVTLLINIVIYACVAAVVTLMVPYFLLDVNAPLPYVFDSVGWTSAKYVVSVGAMCGMSSSLLGGLFPMARVMYAMASDGLIFRCLAYVSPRFITPLTATLLSGSLASLMALLFDLEKLIDMLSIGTLLAFTLVAVSVLILRYESNTSEESSNGTAVKTPASSQQRFQLRPLFVPDSDTPTPLSASVAKTSIAVFCISLTMFCGFATLGYSKLEEGSIWVIVMVTIFASSSLLSLVVIFCQPQNPTYLRFKVPLVPILPALSCLVNIFLMFKLSRETWVRFLVWMILGFCIYFFYGIRHSGLNQPGGERAPLYHAHKSQSYNVSPPSTASPPLQSHQPHHHSTPALHLGAEHSVDIEH